MNGLNDLVSKSTKPSASDVYIYISATVVYNYGDIQTIGADCRSALSRGMHLQICWKWKESKTSYSMGAITLWWCRYGNHMQHLWCVVASDHGGFRMKWSMWTSVTQPRNLLRKSCVVCERTIWMHSDVCSDRCLRRQMKEEEEWRRLLKSKLPCLHTLQCLKMTNLRRKKNENNDLSSLFPSMDYQRMACNGL